ncbi:MAG: hypothetical protein R3192_11240 [Woeseiaceae bacterium]|nr:hypothetical protein [Woeseiaceae bacterium]
MQFVLVTRTAADLRSRLISDRPSPLVYEAEKPADLLAEDRRIEALALDFDDVTVIPSSEVFE